MIEREYIDINGEQHWVTASNFDDMARKIDTIKRIVKPSGDANSVPNAPCCTSYRQGAQDSLVLVLLLIVIILLVALIISLN